MSGDSTLLPAHAEVELVAIGIIEQFIHCLPTAVHDYFYATSKLSPPFWGHSLSEAQTNNEMAHRRVSNVTNFIEQNIDNLVGKTASRVYLYLKTNDIKSENPDPYKFAYWFGVTLAKETLNAFDNHHERIVLLATAKILNRFCEEEVELEMADKLFHKLTLSICEGRAVEEFGANGIYFAFKSISKAAKITAPNQPGKVGS